MNVYHQGPGNLEDEQQEIPEGALRLHCLCGAGSTLQAGEEERWMEAFPDLIFPPVPFPSKQLHAQAGTEMLRSLVRRHHERLLATEVGKLFPEEPQAFTATVETTADFVVEACGGAELFTPKHGPMRMRHRHFAVAIDEQAREIWLRELLYSFDDVGFPAALRETYWRWMESFSIRMITRRTTREQPARYAYAVAAERLEMATRTGRRA